MRNVNNVRLYVNIRQSQVREEVVPIDDLPNRAAERAPCHRAGRKDQDYLDLVLGASASRRSSAVRWPPLAASFRPPLAPRSPRPRPGHRRFRLLPIRNGPFSQVTRGSPGIPDWALTILDRGLHGLAKPQ